MTIDTDKIKDMIEEHMKEQPFEITCSVCGDDIKDRVEINIDGDLDLSLVVQPCECAKVKDES